MTLRRLTVVLTAMLVGFQCLCPAAKRTGNLARNPGLESVKDGAILNWLPQKYWSGTLEVVSERGSVHGGKRCGKLTTGFSRKKHWGRILHSPTLKPTPWVPYRFSIWARGKGELVLGCIRYTKKVPNKPHYSYLWQEPPATLGEQWQQVHFPFSITNPEVTRIALVVELRGEGGEAWLDDAAFVEARKPGYELSIRPRHPMVSPGQEVRFEVGILKDGKPAGAGNVRVIQAVPEGDPKIEELTLQAAGKGVFSYRAAAGPANEPAKVFFVHPDSGCAATVFVDVVDPATLATFERAARKTKLGPLPAHILVIGDSLTDFHRGTNYVDKLEFWLQKAHGPRATVKNVGVGGDYISRVWDRLNSKPRTYRLEMYDGLLEPKPTHILIFLGHNDTKVSSKSGYKKHCVEPDVFDEQYRLTVKKLKQETGAKIVIMSASSSVYEITKASAEKRAAAGKAHNLFGKPEELERYNAIAKKIAADLGCDYLDVYEPTRTHPDKPSLFMPDGVHVNNRGNRLLALEILKYFGGK